MGILGDNLHPASISTILKALQKDLKMDSDEQPLSGHSFRVGAALDLLEQGEPLERIMLRGGWQTDSTAMKYLTKLGTLTLALQPIDHDFNTISPIRTSYVKTTFYLTAI